MNQMKVGQIRGLKKRIGDRHIPLSPELKQTILQHCLHDNLTSWFGYTFFRYFVRGHRIIPASDLSFNILPRNKFFSHPEGYIITELLRWMFHKIGRGRKEDASFASIQGQFAASDCIDDYSGRIGRVLYGKYQFMGMSPKSFPSMRIKQILLSFCHGT